MDKLHVCEVCKNIAHLVNDAGVPLYCCGRPMTTLVANTTEAATEKHLPVVSQEGSTVTVSVGSVQHPMSEDHLIDWVALNTTTGWQYKKLTPIDAPIATFELTQGTTAIAAYEYCNLHGLWKTEI